ncbi:MAG: ATP-binding protein [Candidatus Eremiobacterota bacterium]
MNNNILHDLQERIKELTALHKSATILQDDSKNTEEIMEEIIKILPASWQYPDIAAASITFEGREAKTDNFIRTAWRQSAFINTGNKRTGIIEICYLQEKPPAFEGPFLKEERDLIDSLANMLSSYSERKKVKEALKIAWNEMEEKVIKRTEELSRLNKALEEEIIERKKVEEKIKKYQEELREMTLELSLAEERERRTIASNLHDHIGQALAIIKLKLSALQGNAIFCGFEQNIIDIKRLLDQTIQYTRNVTCELSPPVLYELGLIAAIEWLSEQSPEKYGLKVNLTTEGNHINLPDEIEIILFKAIRELLTNSAKHGHASLVNIHFKWYEHKIEVNIDDNGTGFDSKKSLSIKNTGFGLFSIRERIRYLGGYFNISSEEGEGTEVKIIIPEKTLYKGENYEDQDSSVR